MLLLLLLAGLLLLLLLLLLSLLLLLLLLLLRAVRSGKSMLVHGLLLLLRGCKLSAIVEVGSSSLVVVCPSRRYRCHSNWNEFVRRTR